MSEHRLRGGGTGYLLTRAAQLWRGAVADALRPHDVTPSQFFVLMTILRRSRSSGERALTQRHVVERTGIDPNTASQVVRSLTDRGLVHRDVHPDDARAHALTLSQRGETLAKTCSVMVQGVNDRFFRVVDEDGATDMLQRLINNARGTGA